MTITPAPIPRRFSDNHRYFSQPGHRKVHVYRYFNIQHFLQLLTNRSLWFSRSDHLGDPCEGSRPRGDARIYAAAEQAIAAEGDISYLRQVRGSWQSLDEIAKQRMFISCWQMSEHEQIGMWERYCHPKQAGVAIRSTYARLDAALPTTYFKDRPIGMGLVTYGDYQCHEFCSDPSDIYSTFMMKKIEHAEDHEVRIILDMSRTTATGLPVKIDVETLVEQVIFSPYMADDLARGAEGRVRKLGYRFPISHSSVLEVARVY